jgi:ABC-type multidrug transport system ATPase subunit
MVQGPVPLYPTRAPAGCLHKSAAQQPVAAAAPRRLEGVFLHLQPFVQQLVIPLHFNMIPIVSVQNLTKQFSGVTAVNDLSFTVNEGDVYGFLGQNGAGKSTTIRMLLTLIKPTGGEVQLFGKNLLSHRNEVLKQVGAIIERPDLYKYLSAYHNLSIFAKLSGIKANRKQLMEQLDMVGLADRAQSRVKTYSQGMKQRLGIAIALVHNPKLVILDEPTNGLDPQGIADMRNLILRMSRQMGKTVIVSSHLLSEIELIATRMLIINKGEKVVEGSVTELLDPAKTLVQIDSADPAAALNWVQQSKWAANGLTDSTAGIKLQMNRADIPELAAALVAAGIPLLAIQPRHSLEDYFLQLTTPNQHVAAFTN